VFDQLEDAKSDVQLPEYLANSRFHKVGCGGIKQFCSLAPVPVVGVVRVW
jgi:hypothetical protein